MKGIIVILKDGGTYEITRKQIEYWEAIYPEIDVQGEIAFLQYMWSGNNMPRRTANGINRFISKYLSGLNKTLEERENYNG